MKTIEELQKYAWIIGAVCLGALVAAFYFGRQTVWTEIDAAPADTVTVERVDSMYIDRVEVHIDTFTVTKVETVKIQEEQWFVASLDTIVRGVRISADYISPIPLSPRGFFANIRVSCPDTLARIPVQTHYITKTVVNKELPSERIALIFGVGFAVGAFSGL